MTNFFFERYRPEICRGLHKWCCERILRRFRLFRAKNDQLLFWEIPTWNLSWTAQKQILRHLRLFRAKKFFSKNLKFFDFFCISGVTDFLKNDQHLFWEIPLRTNFKAVSSEKKFFRNFSYPGSQISWKWLHKWCCKQILRHLRLFRAKVANFFFSWKMTNYFFAKYRPEIFRGLHKWCCERIIRRFGSFRAKKFFFKNLKFFDFFCISGVTDFLKNDQLAWNLLWTAQMVLRTNFKAFKVVSSAKFFFQKLEIFWLFLHIQGHRFLEKWLTTFLRNTGLKFVVDCTNGVANKF